MSNKFQLNNEEFVKRIIDTIEKGVPAWRKGWESNNINFEMPSNATTAMYYQGINANRLVLEQWMNGYTDSRWATFNQIKASGWKLQKGAKGVPVYKWTEYDKKTKSRPDWDALNKLDKEELKKYINDNIYWGMTNSGYVFNGDFIEGLSKREKKDITAEEVKTIREGTIEQIENLVQVCSKDVPINYNGGNKAYYQLYTDSIHLPKKENFNDKYSEYSTTIHEIAHATGHSKRLNRDMSGNFGSKNYAKEELRAEIASMMLCMELGKNLGQPQFENHTAYLKSWIEVLNDDYTEFNRAVSDANKITEYVKSNYMNQQRQQAASPALQTMRDGANKVQKNMQRGQINQKAQVKNNGNFMG